MVTAGNSGQRNAGLPDFAEMTKKGIEEFIGAQRDLLDKLQAANRQWLDRWQAEAHLASEFASDLSNVRSFPDAITTCQSWSGRWLSMMAEDGKHLFDDTQQFVATGTRFLSSGWEKNPVGPST